MAAQKIRQGTCVPGRHVMIGRALQQEHRRLVAIDEIDRLRTRLLLRRRTEHADERGIGQRQEIIGAGQTNETGELPRLHVDLGQPALVGSQQRADMRTRRMSHEEHHLWISTVLGGMRMHPRHGLGRIAHEPGHAYLRIFAIVGNGHHQPMARQGFPHPAIPLALAVLPTAAIEEHHHREIFGVTGCIHVQRKLVCGIEDDVATLDEPTAAGRGVDDVKQAGLAARQQQRQQCARQRDHAMAQSWPVLSLAHDIRIRW